MQSTTRSVVSNQVRGAKAFKEGVKFGFVILDGGVGMVPRDCSLFPDYLDASPCTSFLESAF